jgi:oxygen-independent coproporphyrinogen-3 oxidase
VQEAVNRVQSIEEDRAGAARGARQRLQVDLVRPHLRPAQAERHQLQPHARRGHRLSPDRLSIYNYAHLPSLFKPQRRIADASCPSADAKLQILQLAIRRLTEAGYVYIGMDHFAKPDDELAVAQRQGRLHRNFQGYSTHAECDMMSFGISSISMVGPQLLPERQDARRVLRPPRQRRAAGLCAASS